MSPRALKLGTRRSALARAQSGAVARELERLHPGRAVELIGIDTRGDRILDQPLSAVEGKEFFTAEIDAALLRGDIDFTVHSYKDLALERDARLLLAAVPHREQPHDVVIFAADAAERLAAGEPLRIGSSSPRRASFIPEFLQRALPQTRTARGDPRPAQVQLVDLRGNVDSRLRRLREPRGSVRHLDGVVLAFAGLARLAADEAVGVSIRALLEGLPRLVLPLSVCPSAPAQGALAIECRRDDAQTRQLLESLDDPAAREAVEQERALLGARGGGCQQRFGAVLIRVPHLGALRYTRAADEVHGRLQIGDPQLQWTPAAPLPKVAGVVHAWDGSRAASGPIQPDANGIALAQQRLATTRALFIAHRRALPSDGRLRIPAGVRVWVSGVTSWLAMAREGIWVEGCADGLGIGALSALLSERWLQLPPLAEWLVLTHADAICSWPPRSALATYRLAAGAELPPVGATHLWWSSATQFSRWTASLASTPAPAHRTLEHACGPGKTHEQLRAAGVQNLRVFPSVEQWRAWLGR